MIDKLYRLMDWPRIEAIVYSEEDNPHLTLGVKQKGGYLLFQTFQPGAQKVFVNLPGAAGPIEMELADEEGFFAALVPGRLPVTYTYTVMGPDGGEEEITDPYQFEPVITKEDTARFSAGIHYEAYHILGAHIRKLGKVEGVHFAVWAPGAIRVSVVGDFNSWDGRKHQMRRLWDSGIFELFLPCAKQGQNYKFELKLKGGLTYLKADPYAFGQQLRPETASVVRDIGHFSWEDADWLKERAKKDYRKEPMSVYELYLGSFKKPEDGRYYENYRELAPQIIEYVKRMGYTHIELMPVMEHPLDNSWGYQVIGYYAPTSRYGTAADFMYFMNEMHKAGIGVILDWVPAHFPRDTYGLSSFDGTCLYEHKDPRKGSHPHWGTLIYNYGRPEVCNYLIANALYWVEKYHADGIRMDAVASMLYLDYGKRDGEWVANLYGGNENLEAVEFLKHLNSILHKRNPGVLTIAEESTAWPKVTGDLNDGGLGFDLKWNMGWMNDFLGYIRNDPYFRSYQHGGLTFSLIYAYSEQFMLVFSHDEVVHGKASLIGKMPGSREQKFANLRASYAYMTCHPGKKLLFMGQDLAEFNEWNEDRELEWGLLRYDEHRTLNRLVADLNGLYRTHPALTEKDSLAEGFEWINCINAGDCTLSFLRRSEQETLLVAVNFAGVKRTGYQIGVPFAGKYKELLNTDDKAYGGSGYCNARVKESRREPADGRFDSVKLNLAPLSVSILLCTPYTQAEQEALEAKKAEKERRKAETAVRRAAGRNGAKKAAPVKKTLQSELAEKVARAEKAIASGSEGVRSEVEQVPAAGKTGSGVPKKAAQRPAEGKGDGGTGGRKRSGKKTGKDQGTD